MELNEFVKLFAAQFEETSADAFTPELNFQDLEEWSSLTMLNIIALADDSFDVELTDEEISASETIKDVYDVIMSKIA